MTNESEQNDSEQPDEYPEEFTDGNGNLELTDGVEDAITVQDLGRVDDVPSSEHPVHRATHEPLDISEDYRTARFASGMNPNALQDTPRRQLVRDHPEILDHHTGDDTDTEDAVDDPWPIHVTLEILDGEVNAGSVTAMTEYLTEHPDGDLYERAEGKALRETADGEVSLTVREDGTVEVTNVSEFSVETDGGQRIPKTLTGGAEVHETERCDGAGDDPCVREDPELTRGEDEINVTEFGPAADQSGRRVLCGECKDKQTALIIAETPSVTELYQDELPDLKSRFPDILGDVDVPATDGAGDQYAENRDTPLEQRDTIPPADVVGQLSEPLEHADKFAKLELDEKDHRLGGFWFPYPDDARGRYANVTDVVDALDEVPDGDLIHFPHDDRLPEMAGERDVPWWVHPRHVDAELGGITCNLDPEPEDQDEPRGEVEMVKCEVCGSRATDGGVTGENHPEGEGKLACSDCLETEPDAEPEDVQADGGRPVTDGGEEPAEARELMNLARHFHDRALDYREAAQNASSKESAVASDQIAFTYDEAAGELRELARFVDGDREDRPAALAHGEAMASEDGLPWEGDGENGGDGR